MNSYQKSKKAQPELVAFDDLPQRLREAIGSIPTDSASVIDSKAPKPMHVHSRSGGSGGFRESCWGHFSEIDEGYGRDAQWVDQIPSWAIFVFGLGIGAALSWLVL